MLNKTMYKLYKIYRKLKTKYYNINELSKLVFIHVPKCGGISIRDSLNKKYQHSFYYLNAPQVYKSSKLYFKTQKEHLNDQQFSERDLIKMAYGVHLFNSVLKKQKCLSGHIACNRQMISTLKEMNYNFVTMIRNPIDRFFSLYFYNLYKKDDFGSTNLRFEEYLKSCSGTTYVYYFGGYRADQRYDSDEAIANAVDNLKEFKVIGRLNKMDLFINEMKHKLGLSLEISKSNKSPAPREKYNTFKNSPEKRAMVREVFQPDLKLFEQLKKP